MFDADTVTVALSLVEKVLSFLQEELSRDEKVINDVRRIKGHLSTMQAFLQDAEGCEGTTQMMRTLVEQIRDVAHDMEDVLDDFMIHAPRSFSTRYILQKGYEVCHHLKHRIPVQELQSNIDYIQVSMSEINNSPQFREVLRIVGRRDGSQAQPYREWAQMVEEDEIMGIDAAQVNLINLLNEGSSRCNTISVVGPSGAGKTVLVRRVYKSKRVIGQFDCHAWLSLTHTHNHEQCLQILLSQFCLGLNELQFPPGADTATKLNNYLGDKRYIVVLDSVRKQEEWASIKQTLPNNPNGSRIIITTQYSDIAGRCSPSDNHVLRISGLEWKESWKLFCKKAYGNDNGECPSDLLSLSQMIVKRCEGLPQPISAVGALLSRRPKERAEWSRVHNNLVIEMQGNCINTMFLPSYYDLPSSQKSCLLYFSIFPEDYSIKRERLIRLWLSEGFVEEHGKVPLEKLAEDTLNELISRNLVHACSRDFRGRVKSCRVLNLMREFVCQKSKEKKFAKVIAESDMHHPRDEIIKRRLSIENASSDLRRTEGLKLASVRSLFMFGLDKASYKMIKETLKRIRWLKVLDLENAPLERFPECLLDVALLLRYLSLRNTNVSIVPKDIKRLRYLEYLDLKQTQVSTLPEEICSLENLQQLLVCRCNPLKNESFEKLQGVEIVGELKVLPFIRKLSIIKVNHSPRFFETLGQLTLLKKLGLVNLREKDGPSLCKCIENMPYLSTLDLTSLSRAENLDLEYINASPAFLEHLYLKGRLTIHPKWFSSLNSLVRLILRGSKLSSSSPFESLQKMPNLMELEMTDAFTGEVLLIDTGGFPKLRTLYIEQFDGLKAIVVYNGTMPMLQKLTVVRCMRLLELPCGLEGLKRLEELMVYDMPEEFTRRLGQSSEDRWMINHIPVIHSFYVSANNTWELQNFSFRDSNRHPHI